MKSVENLITVDTFMIRLYLYYIISVYGDNTFKIIKSNTYKTKKAHHRGKYIYKIYNKVIYFIYLINVIINNVNFQLWIITNSYNPTKVNFVFNPFSSKRHVMVEADAYFVLNKSWIIVLIVR